MCLTFLRNIVVAHIPENLLKWLYMNDNVIGAGTERVLNWTFDILCFKIKDVYNSGKNKNHAMVLHKCPYGDGNAL